MIINLDKINPIKKEKIVNCMNFIDDCNQKKEMIDKVIIFGSSVRADCTEESDIDMCLFTDYTCKDRDYFNVYSKIARKADDPCDIFVFKKISDKFKKHILQTGVVVYEYKKN